MRGFSSSCGRFGFRCWWSTKRTAFPSGATISDPTISKSAAFDRNSRILPAWLLTATATARVQTDLCKRLSLRDPFQIGRGLPSANLALSVRLCQSRQEKLATLERLVRADRERYDPDLLRHAPGGGGGGGMAGPVSPVGRLLPCRSLG